MFFDDEFENILRNPFLTLDKIFDDIKKNIPGSNTFYYGYTMTMGPDGVPRVREFGNVRPDMFNKKDDSTLVDLMIDKKENVLKLISTMPGVEKSDINVVVEPSDGENVVVCIDAERGDKRYHTRTPIKWKIDEESVQASYLNGILEVKFNLRKTNRVGKKVNIE